MILTVTMNPSLDISYTLSELQINKVNRSLDVCKTAGGKGLNVTRVLHQLGASSLATGVLGGFLGRQIESLLKEDGISNNFLLLENQETRNSIALLHEEGKQTEILEAGPILNLEEIEKFKNLYKKLLTSCDLIILSGSLPKGVSLDFYSHLISIAKEKGIPIFLDTSQKSLKTTLSQGKNIPYLIKPNLEEVNDLVGANYREDNEQDLKEILTLDIFKEIPFLVISLGKKGAVARFENQFFRISIPEVKAVNPVGSGDSTIAGFAYAFSQKKSLEEILKTGMTTGILNALEKKTGYIDVRNFNRIFDLIDISYF